jgi:hypothetical protein
MNMTTIATIISMSKGVETFSNWDSWGFTVTKKTTLIRMIVIIAKHW